MRWQIASTSGFDKCYIVSVFIYILNMSSARVCGAHADGAWFRLDTIWIRLISLILRNCIEWASARRRRICAKFKLHAQNGHNRRRWQEKTVENWNNCVKMFIFIDVRISLRAFRYCEVVTFMFIVIYSTALISSYSADVSIDWPFLLLFRDRRSRKKNKRKERRTKINRIHATQMEMKVIEIRAEWSTTIKRPGIWCASVS